MRTRLAEEAALLATLLAVLLMLLAHLNHMLRQSL